MTTITPSPMTIAYSCVRYMRDVPRVGSAVVLLIMITPSAHNASTAIRSAQSM